MDSGHSMLRFFVEGITKVSPIKTIHCSEDWLYLGDHCLSQTKTIWVARMAVLSLHILFVVARGVDLSDGRIYVFKH